MDDLPLDAIHVITLFLPTKDVLKFFSTCKTYNDINTDTFWEDHVIIHYNDFPVKDKTGLELVKYLHTPRHIPVWYDDSIIVSEQNVDKTSDVIIRPLMKHYELSNTLRERFSHSLYWPNMYITIRTLTELVRYDLPKFCTAPLADIRPLVKMYDINNNLYTCIFIIGFY